MALSPIQQIHGVYGRTQGKICADCMRLTYTTVNGKKADSKCPYNTGKKHDPYWDACGRFI